MLAALGTSGIGPAPRFAMQLAERLNIITGDNGLGKSFLLDLAWWVCARDWAGEPAMPLGNGSGPKTPKASQDDVWISATVTGANRQEATARYRFVPVRRDWKREGRGRPSKVGLVLYARVDGGFSVWDPARHYYKASLRFGIDDPDRPPAFHFNRDEIWKGKKDDQQETICRGVLIDWSDWQKDRHPAFTALTEVLRVLSPDENDPLRIADQPVRLPGGAVDRIPALETAYGRVPVTLASAGVRRIIALAYLLVWTWTEHQQAAIANGMEPQQKMIAILDEVEAHLHPQWQRRILPALLKVGKCLVSEPESTPAIQFLVSTHAPLVLASMEPDFDPEKDRLFHLALRENQPELTVESWEKRGSSAFWLRSGIFALGEDRSLPAERAIQQAEELMMQVEQGNAPDPEQVKKLEGELISLLPARDPFWGQWHRFMIFQQRASS